MNSGCIPDFGYFDTPEFLSFSLHVITVIATPVHLLGFYCILSKTPEHMKSVKWYLLTLHLWTVLSDFAMNVLTVPYNLFPALAGIPLGLANYFGVPVIYPLIWAIVCIGAVLISITSIFENRFYTLCSFPGKNRWSAMRKWWLGFHYIADAVVPISIAFDIPDQETAKLIVFQSLPCLPDYIYNTPVFVLALDYKRIVTECTVVVTLLVLEIIFFVIFLGRSAVRQLRSKSISERTFQMQKTFFFALVIQFTVPHLMFVVPMLYIGFSCYTNYFNQAASNWSMLLISTHGIFSTAVMLAVHRPYRKSIRSMASSISST